MDSIFNILNKHLKGSTLYGIMTRLVPLFPERHVSLYTSTARKLCQSQTMVTALSAKDCVVNPVKQEPSGSVALNNNYSSTPSEKAASTEYRATLMLVNGFPSQKSIADTGKSTGAMKTGSDFRVSQSAPSTSRLTGSSTAKEMDNVYKRAHSELDTSQGDGDVSIVSQSVVSTSSKRARSMAQAMEQKAPRTAAGSQLASSVKSSRLSIFDMVNRITAGNPRVPQKASASASSSTALTRANGKCTVCDEAALDPYAARCGHVCCISCWKSWLKQSKKKSCPQCRRDVEYSQLTRLIIKD